MVETSSAAKEIQVVWEEQPGGWDKRHRWTVVREERSWGRVGLG